MGTKNNPGKHDCYASAGPDEPMFILLARDPLAENLVLDWAQQRQNQIERGTKPLSDMDKVREARACAQQIKAWRKENVRR